MSGTSLGGILPGTTGFADADVPGTSGFVGEALGTGNSRFGWTLSNTGNGGMDPFSDLWEWLNKPFTTPLAATDIFLLIGIVLVSIILWNIILYHIRIAAETL